MRSSTFIPLAALPLLALAQDRTVYVVTQPLSFEPASITADEGSVITFAFTGAPGNHTVTQSSFADPCNPVAGGFDSGFVFIPPANVSSPPTWELTITNGSAPIWFYCKQGNHCVSRMVGAINAPAEGERTFEAFQSAAAAHQGPAGQGIGGLVGIGASASAPPTIPSGASGVSLYGTPTGGASAPTGTPTGTPAGNTSGRPTNTSPAPTGTGTGAGPAATSPPPNGALAASSNSMLLGLGALLGAIVL